ncbi:MAG: bifunctional oligoribonuclease/PAP phosphatase NrnA [Lachnospiraceae bacterium]|nr:bifunctional oligoribonuclease/PAP phosphatase NrnA [Lachnospiraceae bacterium]
MKTDLLSAVDAAQSIAVAGHTRPDGDCIGAVLGLYNYIEDNYPGKRVTAFLEPIPDCFGYLRYSDLIRSSAEEDEAFDLLVVLDTSDAERIGATCVSDLFRRTENTFVIDHHISNSGEGRVNVTEPYASSACEVLFTLFDEDRISDECAKCLFTGIVTDTGCFRHPNTGRRTMEIAGKLLEHDIDSPRLIDEVFYEKTYVQNQLMGECLVRSRLVCGGRYIYSYADLKLLREKGAAASDLEGVVNQLRVTKGVEAAVMMTEIGHSTWKVSLRSNGKIDVNAAANAFGGGGHKMAAGCEAKGDPDSIMEKLARLFEEQMTGDR